MHSRSCHRGSSAVARRHVPRVRLSAAVCSLSSVVALRDSVLEPRVPAVVYPFFLVIVFLFFSVARSVGSRRVARLDSDFRLERRVSAKSTSCCPTQFRSCMLCPRAGSTKSRFCSRWGKPKTRTVKSQASSKSIVQETEYFDTDYRTAVREPALLTPSDELSQFLTDMLSIVNSGGNMEQFLDDKKEKHLRTAKQEQEMTLETLELFGEMYMTLSLFPLLLIIILVIMSMLGQAQQSLLYATVYGLIPLTGVGFLVLVSTVKQDEPGDGYLAKPRRENSPSMRASACSPRAHRELHGDLLRLRPDQDRRELANLSQIIAAGQILGGITLLVLWLFTVYSRCCRGYRHRLGPVIADGMIAVPFRSTFFRVYVPMYSTSSRR